MGSTLSPAASCGHCVSSRAAGRVYTYGTSPLTSTHLLADDYIGEPGGWPHVSSSFGSYDLAGFPKAAVWWYRSWWLANISVADAGRPGLNIPPSGAPSLGTALQPVGSAAPDPTAAFVHIVESPTRSGKDRVVHVYTNCPSVRLAGQVQAVERLGWATFKLAAGPSWKAEALAEDGSTVLATHVVALSGAAAAVKLSLDVPSPRTGTGDALYLDGVDTALVRAEVLDTDGTVVRDCAAEIAFSVESGPAALLATANGDPADHVVIHSPTRKAYHGLARAFIRSKVDASGTAAERALRKTVNADAGLGHGGATIVEGAAEDAASDVVVMACADGLPCAQLTIPTSAESRHSPLEVAARSVELADISD